MKNILFLIVSIIVFSCNNSTKKQPTEDVSEKIQIIKEVNIIVEDTVDGGMMMLGKINRDSFDNELFSEWYKENYNEHVLDTSTIEKVKPQLNNVSIKVYMGTWCSDSQREVPALYKILRLADFDYNYVEMIAVSHEKETPNHLEKGFDIQYVPTIIFYKNEKEIGRFVELAQETLEKDMLAILNEEGYKHSYEE